MIRMVLFVFMLSSVFPGTLAAKEDAFTKPGRGFSNIITVPIKLYMKPVLTNRDHEGVIAASGVPAKGIAMLFVRMSAGIYELVAFPFRAPRDYNPFLNRPRLSQVGSSVSPGLMRGISCSVY
ncbi:MAG: hypothetical protein BWY42_01737 [Candidatus Omnitrophica bacterium ADurb.Bin277]|nr:MAG: hypothetical protein BWY42_01737 [Candidatus Omnitrophica bacterium ADurb.Bin277]